VFFIFLYFFRQNKHYLLKNVEKAKKDLIDFGDPEFNICGCFTGF